MVLNIFMRWPALIVISAIGGAGTVVYKNVPEAKAAVQATIQFVKHEEEKAVPQVVIEPDRVQIPLKTAKYLER